MSDYKDEYQCPWCSKPVDLGKTNIDIILRKFDINECLIKCNKKNEKLKFRLEEAEAILKDFVTTTVPSREWVDEMNATIREFLDEN